MVSTRYPCRLRGMIASSVLSWLLVLGGGELAAQQPQKAVEKAAAKDTSSRAAINALLVWIARENIPSTYEDRKDWGGTREIVTGLRLVGRGRKLRTAAHRKSVKHGTWKMYRVALKDPARGFQITLDRMQVSEDEGLVFEATVEARLEMLARWAQWSWGVQLISFNALADARVRMKLTGKMAIRIDPRQFPPDVTIHPRITGADLHLESFRLLRISQLHGSLVHRIGDEARRIIEKKLAEKREDLVAKINRQIEKNQEQLKVSLREYIQQEWGRLSSGQLPKKIR
ncbi:MAG: hypothetical protein VB877_03470 [Pirellulaceae bacterium]